MLKGKQYFLSANKLPMRVSYMDKIRELIRQAEYKVTYADDVSGIMKIENEQDGIKNLIIGVVPPVLIMEYYLFSFKKDSIEMFKALLQKNRDMLHGAFVINEDGDKVLYRYTMQIENMDFNEFEAALNALSLLLYEYREQMIYFSKR